MCGICGIASSSEQGRPDAAERVQRMCDAQAHRGPDDAGQWVSRDGRICLGNRRLAIRDLSSAGHMPMTNETGSLWITYNGEIYNVAEVRPKLERLGYPFRSNSDTEVILHGYAAWGSEVVQQLRGMFAFAIVEVDPTGRARRMFLARDRLGIKPLYYTQQGNTFLFASELKALRASGLIGTEIDPAALTGYLMLGAVPNPLTIYQGVAALPPASTLSWEQGQITVQSYWQLPTEVDEAVTPEQAAETVRDLLLEAVRIRLVSDMPLGAFLSGGLDSSAVVALMRAARGAATNGVIRTCSMTFAEAAYNEAPYARAVAEAAGTEHFERVISSEDVKREWDKIFTALDQPSVDGVNTYFVSQTAREAGLTVALSGLGGDELFGGYSNTFNDVPRVLKALQMAQGIPGGALLARATLSVMPGKARWSRVKDALDVPASPASAYLTRRGLFAPSEVRDLLQPEIWQQGIENFDPTAYVTASVNGTAYQASGFDWISRAELRTYMHHQLLRDTDVMSMSHSLEVRVPLIDHRLVEMVLRLPETVRRQGGGTLKPLLMKAVGKDLPPLVTQRQNKQGFTFPFALWLRGDLHSRVAEVLEQVLTRGWLQAAAVQRVREDYEAGRVHWSRLWAIVALNSVR